MNIYDTVNQLERELRALPEYIALKEAREAVKSDSEASKLFEEFKKFQQEIDQKMVNGEAPSEGEQNKIQEFSEKIGASNLLSEMFAKEQIFGQTYQDIMKIIQAPVSELYN